MYTYPMVLLSDVPSTLPQDDLERLQATYFTSFGRHIFLSAVEIDDSPSRPLPPYLQLAMACLSWLTCPLTVTSVNPETGTVSADASASLLFLTGANLWSVMLEVDNREARMQEAVVAVRTSQLPIPSPFDASIARSLRLTAYTY